jgi:ABC-type microcin C transport system permease subunit YejB
MFSMITEPPTSSGSARPMADTTGIIAFLIALSDRDYPIVSGVNLFFGCGVVLINLLIDLVYVYLDPRIRYQ